MPDLTIRHRFCVPIEDKQEEHFMTMERYIRAIAGSFVMGSLVLSRVHSTYWLLFTAFVGVNLAQSAFTRWCLMEKVLARIGVGGSDR